MRLGIQMLNNSSTLNNLLPVNQIVINPGETYQVYFQLVDLDAPLSGRYIPLSGSTLSIQLFSINNNGNISKNPFNPFPSDDRSIWAFNLSSAETLVAAGINMLVTLTEGSSIRIARADGVIIIGSKSMFSC